MFGERRINSLNDSDNVARTCAQYFDSARDSALRSHLWNFAMSRKELTALSDAPIFEYTYAYPLPQDFIRLAACNDTDRFAQQGCTNFAIEGNEILTNDTTCKIRYVRREEDVSQYDALFVTAFSTLLASQMVGKLSGDWQQAGQLLRSFSGLFESKAAKIDANEDRHRRRSPARRSRLVTNRWSRDRR